MPVLILGFSSSQLAQFSYYKVMFISDFDGNDLNDSSEIVSVYPATGHPYFGAKWKNGNVTQLPLIAGFAVPISINNTLHFWCDYIM